MQALIKANNFKLLLQKDFFARKRKFVVPSGIARWHRRGFFKYSQIFLISSALSLRA
jgi:hypothetical protein